MKITVTFAIFAILSPYSQQAQSWKWANSLGTPNFSTKVAHIRPYSGSDVIVCGAFAAPELELGTHSFFNAGQEDGFLAIVDEDGQYSWAGTLGSQGRDFVVDAAAAPDGSLIAGGTFTSISLPVGSTTLFNEGETDAFLVKYHPDKTIAWVKAVGSPNLDEITGVAVDANGNIYVSGQVTDKFSLQTNIVFLKKYNPAGTLLWEKQGFSQNDLEAPELAIDDQQNAYLSSRIWGVASFEETSVANEDYGTAFVLKYSPAGVLLDTCLHPEWGRINSMQAKGDHLYLCAESMQYCIGWGWPLSDSKIYVTKMDAGLHSVWSQTAGGVDGCQSLDIAHSIGVDNEGNAYVTGTFFSDTLDFAGQSLPNLFHINYYYPQVFVLKYGPDGQELWAKSIGGIHSEEGAALQVVGDDLFYLGGHFESEILPFDAHILQNEGLLDSFYVHLRPVRYGRAPMGFVALFEGQASGVPPQPHAIDAAIWPNPAQEYVVLSLKTPTSAPGTLSIGTPEGRLIRQAQYGAGIREVRVPLSGWAPGVYRVTLTSQQGVFSGQFLYMK